ncbi:hypothetical protein R1sor_003691 [Riccia sorocarpa]|uniref:Amino acid transporter transmembrane domain-containing protein n=1 Tax=Riccia sorocarpa TaxID=122646 RepID=A0ABD3H8H1_9MARC
MQVFQPAALAQLVERKALNLVVGGSSPPGGVFLFLNFTVVHANGAPMCQVDGNMTIVFLTVSLHVDNKSAPAAAKPRRNEEAERGETEAMVVEVFNKGSSEQSVQPVQEMEGNVVSPDEENAVDPRKEVEFDDDMKPARTGTVLHATAHVVTAVIGSGVLGLPWSIAQLGWLVGTLMLVFFAWVTLYTSNLLADSYRYPDPVTGRRNYTYKDAVSAQLGKRQVIFCAVAQYLNLLGTAVGYTVTTATSMVGLQRSNCFHREGHGSKCHASNIPYMMICGSIQLLLSQFPDFSTLKFISIVAACMSCIYSSIGLGLSLSRVIANGEVRGPLWGTELAAAPKTWAVAQALGNIGFAYSFSMVLIEIQDTVRGPPRFTPENKTMKDAARNGIGITTFFYTLVGCLGYGSFGVKAPGNILTGFGFYNPFWLLDIGNLCVVIHLLGAYQVYAQPIFAAVESSVRARWPESSFLYDEQKARIPFTRHTFTVSKFRLVWRTFFVVLVTLVASAIPFFNDINGLIGAISFFPLTVYFPTALFLNSCGKAGRPECSRKNRWRIWVLRVVSGLITLVAVVGSFQGIIESVKGTRLFHSSN